MSSTGDPRAVMQAVRTALDASPAFRQLDSNTRADLTGALGRIGGYMNDPRATALADPVQRPDGEEGPGGTVGRVGEVARATLNAIDFPSFVAALIKGTFQAIVDATIQQMEAYATLLQEVAKTVDDYMRDNVTDDAARDYLTDRYGGVFHRDTTGGQPTLEVDRSQPAKVLPSFFQDLGFDNVAQLDRNSVEEVVVPAARKTIAEQRHQTLATMVLLGLNRIVIDDGEINAKLQFHIDASETTAITFDSTQTSIGNLAGVAGGATFSGQGIMVNTTSINAQSDINVRSDLTGEVRVRFSSDVLPLERFADSNAIQLINQHATVPTRRTDATPQAEEETTTSEQVETPSLSASAATDDPWSPRR